MYYKERNIGLDLLRIFACLLVVMYHVPMLIDAPLVFNDISSRALNSLMFYFGRTAVPIFFILSGYFILPLRYGTTEFFKKRISRVLFPTAFWFIVYYLFGKSWYNPNVTLWTEKAPHLWYMYALLGIYLIAPIISQWYKMVSIKEKLFYITLWGISLLLVLSKSPISLEFNHQGLLYSTPYHALLYVAGYIGYFVLGAIIKEKSAWILNHAKQIFSFCVITYVVLVLICHFVLDLSDSNTIAYLSLPTSLLSMSIFVLFLLIDNVIFKTKNMTKDCCKIFLGGGKRIG